jgi:hypothetical protein
MPISEQGDISCDEEADICLIWDAGSDREYICHFPTIQLVETVSVFCQS